MRKIVLIILCSVFLINCSQKDQNDAVPSSDSNIDTLLSKANNYNLDKNDRLKYASKVYALIQNKNNDSLKRYYYFKLAGRYYNLEEYDKYLKICRDVYKMSEKSKDTLAIAKSLHYIGDYHYNKFKNDSAYYYYVKAEKTYKRINSNENISELNLYKAKILFYEKDFSGCETATITLLKNAKLKNDIRLIYECYLTLGNALEGLNNDQQALEYYHRAYEATDNLKKDPQIALLKAQTINYIGRIYLKEEKYSEAITCFKQALLFSNFRDSEPLMYANLINNLAYAKFKSGDKSSITLLKEALKIRQNLGNIPGIVSSKINLSEYYLIQKDTSNAFSNSVDARKIAVENKIFEDELKALKLLSRIDYKRDAIYKDRFIKLTDSLQNNERATRNKFARIEFETDEILNQKNHIEAEKNEISSQRWLILGGSLFFILLVVLLYITKVQHAKNKELQFEQEQQKANEEIYQLMLEQQTKIDEGRINEQKRIS
ncbi:MAG: tetratricopeptide repeat protein, partial [Flavobacterium sp.]